METLRTLIGPDSNDITWWQMSIRAVVVFAYGLVLIRIAGRRAFGSITSVDIVLGVMLGSLLSRTLTANSPFVPTLAAAAALVGLHAFVAWLSRRSHRIGRIVKGEALRLVEDGRLLHEHLRHANLTEGDLMEALRTRGGVDDLGRVRGAWLERSGDISVVTRDG